MTPDSRAAKIKFLLEIIKTDGYTDEVKEAAKTVLRKLGVDLDDHDRCSKISREVDMSLGIRPDKVYGYKREGKSMATVMVVGIIVSILLGIGMVFGLISITTQSGTTSTPTIIESTTESSTEGKSL